MNPLKWFWWVLTWRPTIRVGQVGGKTRLLRSARTEVYGGIKVRWADEQEDRK